MPAAEQPSRTVAEDDERFDLDDFPGVDPGELETWDIFRVHCPECDRPIALLGDEDQLPQHAVLPTAWHPFSAALCAGTGAPTEDLTECDSIEHAAVEGLTLGSSPAEFDWRTHPFSHASAPGSGPLERRSRVPAQRSRAGLVRH
ncbi:MULTISPECIES: hypothetical protein [unclassified Kitasatospora]|uniref:hypothetical protein n=1 Tax=unclassified Kitasatospora TaxID=2633591 RepID=UPI0012F82BCC|nr:MULTISPECIES: hypothetical protein [unclassified Kitasatospora]